MKRSPATSDPVIEFVIDESAEPNGSVLEALARVLIGMESGEEETSPSP